MIALLGYGISKSKEKADLPTSGNQVAATEKQVATPKNKIPKETAIAELEKLNIPVNLVSFEELVRKGATKEVELCLAAEINPNSTLDVVYNNFFSGPGTALTVAAAHNNLDIVNLLLSYGADPNIKNCYRETPLIIAAREGYTEVAKAIIKSGKADPNLRDGQKVLTPLMWAAKSGNMGVVRALVEDGRANTRLTYGNYSALKFAKDKGNIAVVDYLASMGVKETMPFSAPPVSLTVAAEYDQSKDLITVKGSTNLPEETVIAIRGKGKGERFPDVEVKVKNGSYYCEYTNVTSDLMGGKRKTGEYEIDAVFLPSFRIQSNAEIQGIFGVEGEFLTQIGADNTTCTLGEYKSINSKCKLII